VSVDTCPKCGKDMLDVCPICKTPVAVYSRVVGYLRPVSTWNDGKQQEFRERTEFAVSRKAEQLRGDHPEER
jgi:anaerobic ribonucleoside-triphosphate reductase